MFRGFVYAANSKCKRPSQIEAASLVSAKRPGLLGDGKPLSQLHQNYGI
jgi:hypothetical protein